MKIRRKKWIPILLLVTAASVTAGIYAVLWEYVPRTDVRYTLLAFYGMFFVLTVVWNCYQRCQITSFADEICQTVDALIADRQPQNYHPYEDSLTTKVQSKLLQYYTIMNEGRNQSQQDKQTIQQLVSDISHQVKTPIANLQMFVGILEEHSLSEEKRTEFLQTIAAQINKLDFLMQSLIKMSRLETGTFTLHMEKYNLYDTIAQAINSIWGKADCKHIQIEVDCPDEMIIKHDPKWTAEAFGNILDNAVKYTPEWGNIHVNVRSWQFYVRIDITDTGIGISEKYYADVFKRFYRTPEVTSQEGIGLGLYLSQGIITRQKGYISVKSIPGSGTTFSIYMIQ